MQQSQNGYERRPVKCTGNPARIQSRRGYGSAVVNHVRSQARTVSPQQDPCPARALAGFIIVAGSVVCILTRGSQNLPGNREIVERSRKSSHGYAGFRGTGPGNLELNQFPCQSERSQHQQQPAWLARRGMRLATTTTHQMGKTTEPVACSGRGGFGDAVLSYRMIYHDGEGRRSRRARLAQVIDFARRRARTQSDVRFCRSLAVGKAAVSKEESQAACR